MIHSVTVINHLGESLTLELMFPEKSGFVIRDINGLGPSKATINSTPIATGDGSMYNSARVSSRNIVLSLGFLFKPDIETVRQLSYKYFPIKKKVQLIFKTDNRLCSTYGYVESNTPDIFSSDSGTQISINCPDAYFYSLGDDGTTVTVFSGVEPNFSFPFSNESTSEKKIQFGIIRNTQEKNIIYTGEVETGVLITIHAIGVASNITIYNTGTRDMMKIDTAKLAAMTGSGIIAGDDIIINTVQGQKSITLLRNGVYTNILNCLDRDSDWFQITKGDNLFAYSAEVGNEYLQFRIENFTVFEGV